MAASGASAARRPRRPAAAGNDGVAVPRRPTPAAGEVGPQEPSPPPARWSLTVANRTTRAHGRRTVAWLLDAAVAEFAAYGYHGASMARIARRAGTAHGTVYLHFSDKDDLLHAAMTDVLADFEPVLLAVPPFRPGEEGLDDLWRWLRQVCDRYQQHGALLLAVGEALAAPGRSRVESEVLAGLDAAMAALEDRVRVAGTSELDPQVAALAIMAMIEGANRVLFRGRLLVGLDDLAMSLAEFIQRSIFGA